MKRGFNMSRTLCDLPLGDLATISHITAPPAIKKRFMDMGFVKGCEVTVEKVAPMGNPLQVSLKGYSLCIRKEDAKYISLA